MWLSTLEIGAAQFRFVTECASKSPPFLFVYRSPIRSTVFGLQLLINFTGLALTFETGWCFVLSGNDKWNLMVFSFTLFSWKQPDWGLKWKGFWNHASYSPTRSFRQEYLRASCSWHAFWSLLSSSQQQFAIYHWSKVVRKNLYK